MGQELKDWQQHQQNGGNYKALRKSLKKALRKMKDKTLDEKVHNLHHEAFEKIDCLECANCCKTTSPAFYEADITRLAKALKMKEQEFVDQYLMRDDDGVYMLKSAPCPFLDADNYCMVYKSRPKACREYPHTDRRRFKQILNLSFTNADICPAVYHIFERLQEEVGA